MKRPLLHTSTADTLRKMIFSGDTFAEGDRLPSEPDLARELGISRTTLREALQQLEGEGLLLRRHGIGTFVRNSKPSITLKLTIPRSLTALIDSLHFIPGVSFMNVTTETVFPDDVERLGVSPGAEVVRIERIRTANSQPVAYTIDVIPRWAMKKYPKWEQGSNFSIIDHLIYRCGLTLRESKSTLIPLHNIVSVSEKLEIDPSSHIFFFEGVDYNDEDTPIIFSREYFAPWIFRFSVTRKSEINK